MPGAAPQLARGRMQVNHISPLFQILAVQRVQHRTAAGSQNDIVHRGHALYCFCFAAPESGFAFNLESLGVLGNTSPATTIVYGNSYSLLVISATGGILGFDAAKFSFDVSKFQDGMIPSSAFSISADANHLYLNFTAVPEPSTWALLITGAGFLGLAALRRRRG